MTDLERQECEWALEWLRRYALDRLGIVLEAFELKNAYASGVAYIQARNKLKRCE